MKIPKNSAVIIGAGPIGLFSAYQILKNKYADNVIIFEKRYSNKHEWTQRGMVVQFHRSLINLADLPEINEKCPCNIQKEQNETHRQKYNDLDHMSINNLQNILLKKLETTYKDSFLLAKLDEIELIQGTIFINTHTKIDISVSPKIIVDATGFHSILMNKILKIPFSEEYEYGSALKITWPEHQLNNKKLKEVEFHDCHESTEYYNQGFSSVAEFSYPLAELEDFLKDCGFYINKKATKLPFLQFDKTPFSIKLPPFLKKIINLEKNTTLYKHALDLFSDMKNGKLSGLTGFDFIKRLQQFNWVEADTLAKVIRNVIDPEISINNIYNDLDHIKEDLDKITIVFVPSRLERWISNNQVQTRLKIISSNIESSIFPVTAMAVGDSLTSTDFRHGLGVNRGLHTATQIFKEYLNPEIVRQLLVKNSYSPLSKCTDDALFQRAVACRDWLTKTK